MFIILDFPFVLCLSRGAFCPASLLNIPPISFFAFQIEKSEPRENVTKNRRFIKNSFDVLLFFLLQSRAPDDLKDHQMTPNGKPSRKLKIPCANNTCGFDPHHRHKKKLPQLVWGSFLFYLRRVRGSNSTALPCRASDQPCGLSLSARETPTTGNLPQLVWGRFLFICGV